jgi:hypothetical protein
MYACVPPFCLLQALLFALCLQAAPLAVRRQAKAQATAAASFLSSVGQATRTTQVNSARERIQVRTTSQHPSDDLFSSRAAVGSLFTRPHPPASSSFEGPNCPGRAAAKGRQGRATDDEHAVRRQWSQCKCTALAHVLRAQHARSSLAAAAGTGGCCCSSKINDADCALHACSCDNSIISVALAAFVALTAPETAILPPAAPTRCLDLGGGALASSNGSSSDITSRGRSSWHCCLRAIFPNFFRFLLFLFSCCCRGSAARPRELHSSRPAAPSGSRGGCGCLLSTAQLQTG